MQRVEFRNSEGLNLVGDFYPVDSRIGVVMCHGFTGDRSESGKFDETAEVLHKKRYNVLRFDFSGSGESDDAPLTVERQVGDLQHAIGFVQERGVRRVGLLGLSLGGLVAARAYPENKDVVRAIVLWAPVTDKVKDPRARYTSKQLEQLDREGFMTYKKNGGTRKQFVIPQQMLDERGGVEQEALLRRIRCPVLIIHGTADEIVPSQHSRNARDYLSRRSDVMILHEANHKFEGYLAELKHHTERWFDSCLKH